MFYGVVGSRSSVSLENLMAHRAKTGSLYSWDMCVPITKARVLWFPDLPTQLAVGPDALHSLWESSSSSTWVMDSPRIPSLPAQLLDGGVPALMNYGI